MKRLVIPVILVLTACGGNENATESSTEQPVDDVTIVQEYVEPEKGHVWQINDYAENLVNSKIYEDMDAVMEHGGSLYYEVLDINNGYARVTGAFEGWYEFVLWRMEDGSDLVGYLSAGCGPVCDYTYFFYNYKDGVKTEITDQVLPLDEMDEYSDIQYIKIIEKYPDLEYPQDVFYKFNFPQQGTSMMVDYVVGAEEVEMPMFLLSWDKSKFSVEETYDKIP